MEKNPWREQFPQLAGKDEAFLDSAASSLKPLSVIAAVDHYYHDLSVNIHRGMYASSYEATRLYEEARAKVAAFIHAKEEEVVFLRGGTAALNLVASSYGAAHLQPGDEVIVSQLEHHSSILPWQALAAKVGAKLVYVPLDPELRITVDNVRSVLTSKTKVVALTYVSNVMGYITPLAEIIALAHASGAIVVADAAQAVQHLSIDVKCLDVDFLAFSGHKMLGPTGIGVLYGKSALLAEMEPIEFGGEMIDEVNKDRSTWKEAPYKFEAGTMPIASAIGLGAAVDMLQSIGLDAIEDHVVRIRRYAFTQLKKVEGIVIYNPTADTGIIAFNIEGVHPHDAATFFAEQHVSLRAGHHCAQLAIKALGIEACLRASFYLYNTYADCDRLVAVAKEAVRFFKGVGF
ncbi:MAG TPA: cysteine desulfurase [Acholeplasmatales bacterium]|nr:MAG: cysteine desulfurase [Tenericutes bacterium GWF2_57_13]HAQ56174.1 cysteine desulfurase [Acholeplasmatales bacterium]